LFCIKILLVTFFTPFNAPFADNNRAPWRAPECGYFEKDERFGSLDWLFPVDNGGSPITEYEIEIWDNSLSEWKFYGSTPAADIGPNCACPHTLSSTSFSVTGLKQDHQYLFRVYAKNAIGRSKPAETSSLAAPKKPEGQ